MSRNIKDLDKYIEKPGVIKLKKEVSELNNWYDFEELLHEANKQCGGDNEKWTVLTGFTRMFDCLIGEIEGTIKNLGGKVLAERERESKSVLNYRWNNTSGFSCFINS